MPRSPNLSRLLSFPKLPFFVEFAYVAENVDDTEIFESADFAGTDKSVEIADIADIAKAAHVV